MNPPSGLLMRHRSAPTNLLFRLLLPASGVFVMTILAMIASLFGDPQAPPAVFLQQHGGRLIAIEVTVILAICALSMTWDRIQILRDLRQGVRQAGTQTPPDEHQRESSGPENPGGQLPSPQDEFTL